MCDQSRGEMLFIDLLRDPLTRLVMRSDGVTKRDMVVLSRRLRDALAARENADRDGVRNHRAPRHDRRRSTRIPAGVSPLVQ